MKTVPFASIEDIPDLLSGGGCTVMKLGDKFIDLAGPEPDEIDFRALAEGAAKISRFCGLPKVPYVIGQHQIVVAEQLPVEARPYGLIHDLHEVVIGGDVVSPAKRALVAYGGGKAWRAMIDNLDYAIHTAAGLPWPPPDWIVSVVKRADLAALATEIRDIYPEGEDHIAANETLPYPLPKVIKPWPWHRALDAYVDRLRRWLPNPID